MQRVFALLLFGFGLFIFSIQSLGQVTPAAAPPPVPYGYVNQCQTVQNYVTEFNKAQKNSGINGNQLQTIITAADKCTTGDSQPLDDNDIFSCSDINSKCPALQSATAATLKSDRDDTRTEAKDAKTAVDDLMDKQADLKEEAAKLAEEYSNKENDMMKDISDEEEAYQKQVDQNDKDALAQIQQIQTTMQEIKDANNKIINEANKAQAEFEAAKLNARKACREQAKKDYAEKLKYLDEQIAKGMPASGGFQGIQNVEALHKFYVAKILQPEPSESYSICYSGGDAVDTEMQQRKMGQALAMNQYAQEIQSNNEKRDQLTTQLTQQQALAKQQATKAQTQHLAKIAQIQQKIALNRSNYKRLSDAKSQKMQELEKRTTAAQAEYEKAQHRADNAEARYNCLNNHALDPDQTGGSGFYSNLVSAATHLKNACAQVSLDPTSTCKNDCGAYSSTGVSSNNFPPPSIPAISAPAAAPPPAGSKAPNTSNSGKAGH